MRLLLAEDEPSLARALKTILEKNNYSVDIVDNGEDALNYLLAGIYDGAVLDIMMPKKDGIQVLKAVREQGNSIPILMLTAKSEVDDRVLGLDSGANDYLTKPFATKELLARLRAMTRNLTLHSNSILHVGNLTLNSKSFELSSPSGSFRLANKEYQMMEMLMQHPKNLISAEHFMTHIWGCDSDADINVVWVYISYLRKKLSALNSNVKICASRNVGYYLEVL